MKSGQTPHPSVHEIEDLDLREIFPREDLVFTPWLSEPENLARLSRGLGSGFDLELVETEASTGTFRTDIVARNAADDSLVIIENQYGRSNHDHLGKTLTYLAAHDARVCVWIAERFADDHKAALTWLNDNTPEEVGFFAVAPKLMRIGDSPPGLRFDVIVAPNQFVKQVKKTERVISSAVKEVRGLFWPMFLELTEGVPAIQRCHRRYGGLLGFLWLIPPNAGVDTGDPHVLVYISIPSRKIGYAIEGAKGASEAVQERCRRAWEHALGEMKRRALDLGNTWSTGSTVPATFDGEAALRAAAEELVARGKICVEALEREL